jgi:hypothetical protein
VPTRAFCVRPHRAIARGRPPFRGVGGDYRRGPRETKPARAGARGKVADPDGRGRGARGLGRRFLGWVGLGTLRLWTFGGLTRAGLEFADILARHVKGRRAARTAWILLNFQSYVKYHIKVGCGIARWFCVLLHDYIGVLNLLGMVWFY